MLPRGRDSSYARQGQEVAEGQLNYLAGLSRGLRRGPFLMGTEKGGSRAWGEWRGGRGVRFPLGSQGAAQGGGRSRAPPI